MRDTGLDLFVFIERERSFSQLMYRYAIKLNDFVVLMICDTLTHVAHLLLVYSY